MSNVSYQLSIYEYKYQISRRNKSYAFLRAVTASCIVIASKIEVWAFFGLGGLRIKSFNIVIRRIAGGFFFFFKLKFKRV
jgi:hypothetical protein